MIIQGTLRNGAVATMSLKKVAQGGRIVWQQRAKSDSARHLQRDYVCHESLVRIVDVWLPCDWKAYDILTEDAEADADATTGRWGDCDS